MNVHSPPNERSASRRYRRLVRAGVISGACLLLGVIEAMQLYVRGLVSNAPTPVAAALGRVLPSWLVLAALAPAILWVSDRYPLDRDHGLRHLPAHVVMFVLFILVHIGTTAIIATTTRVTGSPLPVLFWELINWYFITELLTYGAIVGVHHALRYYHDAASGSWRRRSYGRV